MKNYWVTYHFINESKQTFPIKAANQAEAYKVANPQSRFAMFVEEDATIVSVNLDNVSVFYLAEG